ncbi:MAG: hypothetical protein WCM93_16590 [Bacteroidota bacterium]
MIFPSITEYREALICFIANDILTTKRKNKSGIGFSNEHETWGFINKKGEEDFTGKLGPIKVSINESIYFNNSNLVHDKNYNYLTFNDIC